MKKIYAEMVADLFHYGHVEFLRKARALGDHLTVGVLSDEWTKKHKREPVLTWNERARVVEACRHVDAVLMQADPATDEWLRENGYTHAIALSNGADRARHLATSVGHDRAREVELPYEQGISTSDIIERVETRVRTRQEDAKKIRRHFAPRWGAGEWLLAEKMLADIGSILTTHAMPYFLAFGSHLGAIRHGGVIPWDDDIDIAIREEDEKRLAILTPALKQAGYEIIRYTVTSGPYTEIYYKVWIGGRPSTTGRAHSWPFIDIFVLRPSAADPAQCGLDHRLFPASYIFPLKKARFGALTVPVPNNDDLLAILYDAGYMTRCFSTSYIHRDERLAGKPLSRAAAAVAEAGCFADISALAQKLRNSVPVRIGNHVPDPADTATAALWNRIDGRRSVASLFSLFEAPAIEAMRTVLDGLHGLLQQNVLRLEADLAEN